jgi:hypothetical protein
VDGPAPTGCRPETVALPGDVRGCQPKVNELMLRSLQASRKAAFPAIPESGDAARANGEQSSTDGGRQ